MRKTALLFLIFEILDCLTTYIGLKMGMIEANPIVLSWTVMIMTKAVVVVGVTLFLQKFKYTRLLWIITAIPILTVMWNCINIFVEII